MTKVVFIGECWDEASAQLEFPFVGTPGQEFYRILCKTNFIPGSLDYRYTSPITMMGKWRASGITLLNVFNARPSKESNDVQLFFAALRDNIPVDVSLPRRRFGAANFYCRADMASHVYQLHADLERLKPNLIVALGATATWALGLGEGIGKLRGFVHQTKWGKVLPTYHPGAVLAKWNLRVPLLLDLTKARREMEFPETRQVTREIWAEPSIADLWSWWEQHGSKSQLLAVDIETERSPLQISEVGFASDPYHALHIPFMVEKKSWWKNAKDETLAWKFVKHVCESPIPKIGQNLQYDQYWLLKEMGIKVLRHTHDTMLMSHAWQPELEKSLYFLGSAFLDEASWKNIRKSIDKEDF